MATPHVSGVAALIISAGIATTPDEVRTILQSTAKDLGPPGWDSEYGWGRVDAFAALNQISETDPPSPNPMTWATPPDQAGTSAISMVATTATDSTPPISYFFHFTDSPTGGTGGTDSGWQTSTSYS